MSEINDKEKPEGREGKILNRMGENWDTFNSLLDEGRFKDASNLIMERREYMEAVLSLLPKKGIEALQGIDWKEIKDKKLTGNAEQWIIIKWHEWKEKNRIREGIIHKDIEKLILMVKAGKLEEPEGSEFIDEEVVRLKKIKEEEDFAFTELAKLYQEEIDREIQEAKEEGRKLGRKEAEEEAQAREAEPIQKAPKKPSKKKLAEESGAITLFPNRLSIPTGTPHKNAFNLKREGDAFLISLEGGEIETMRADPETGQLSFIGDRFREVIRFENQRTKEVVTGAALSYIAGLYTIELKYGEGTTGTTAYKVHRPTFCEFMGADPYQNENTADFVEKVKEALKDVVGYMKNGQAEYVVFAYHGRDKTDDTVEFSIPYLSHLRRDIEKNPLYKGRASKKREVFTLPHHSYLIHSDIATQQDQIAVSIVRFFDTLIQSRPNTKRNTIDQSGKKQTEVEKGTVSQPQNISFRTLLEAIPEFNHGFTTQETTRTKNQYLRRRISNAYRMIKENTELMTFFTRLRWYSYDKKGAIDPNPIPTITTLDRVLYFVHEGQNKKWKQAVDERQHKEREKKKAKAKKKKEEAQAQCEKVPVR